MQSGITRRGLLRGIAAVTGLAGVASVAGCDLFGGSSSDDAEFAAEVAALLAQTVALADAYDRAITRMPSLAARLTAARDAHRAHAQALAQVLARPTPPSGSAGAVESSPTRPDDEAAVIAELIEAETKGLDEARSACLSAPGRLAPLIGSIAAARACHLEVLS